MVLSDKQKPELISLHIPKTAGTSFRNILKGVYGENEVVRFDIRGDKDDAYMNEVLYQENHLPNAKVVHGHFVMESLINKFKLPADSKIITWVRDPVKRVISNFFYLESVLKEKLGNETQNLKILKRMQRTLIEYARDEVNRNRQSKFLSGIPVNGYHFIGITEFFENDIERLSHIMKWGNMPDPVHHNKTPETKSTFSEKVLSEIRELNSQDVQLYNEAVRIRNSFINK